MPPGSWLAKPRRIPHTTAWRVRVGKMESGSLPRRASKCTQGHEPWAKNIICAAPHEIRLLPGGNTTTGHLCTTIRLAARDEDEASGIACRPGGEPCFMTRFGLRYV